MSLPIDSVGAIRSIKYRFFRITGSLSFVLNGYLAVEGYKFKLNSSVLTQIKGVNSHRGSSDDSTADESDEFQQGGRSTGSSSSCSPDQDINCDSNDTEMQQERAQSEVIIGPTFYTTGFSSDTPWDFADHGLKRGFDDDLTLPAKRSKLTFIDAQDSETLRLPKKRPASSILNRTENENESDPNDSKRSKSNPNQFLNNLHEESKQHKIKQAEAERQAVLDYYKKQNEDRNKKLSAS